MASENEPAKLLLPYLQRADELQKHEPLVAYYCRLYAMERGLKIPNNQRTKTTNSLLISLMNQLEKDKKSLTLGPDDHLHLEGFALNVFGKADKQDRAGRADLNTAKTFYAASIFFEILNQFGDLAPELEQKQKYAVWKAADIRKAIKEGRKPIPGPPGGEDELTRSSSSISGSFDPDASQPRQDIDPGFENEPPPSQSPHYEDEMRRLPSMKVAPSSQSPHHEDEMRRLPSMKITPSPPPPSYPNDYPTQDYSSSHSIPPPENPTYSQPPYHHQPAYPQGPPLPQTQHHVPENNSYPSQEVPPPFSYPNFQSYPSFSESSLPTVPSHQPSFYQGPDSSYSQQPPSPPAQSYSSIPEHDASHGNGSVQGTSPAPTHSFNYDPNYMPPAEKIVEAHKAARFAVGALAFDDVSVAVDFLKKSLELLTNPSAGE